MFTYNKLNTYIFIFLAFCVISSKHIIIYNEEILVALSFFFFVVFVSMYFTENINSFLDERISNIKYELQNFLKLKKDILKTLHTNIQKSFLSDKIFYTLNTFCNVKIQTNSKDSQKALKNIFYTQIINKLKNLSYISFNFKHKLQKYISSNILTAVLVKNKNIDTKNKKYTNTNLNFDYLKKAIK